MATIIHLLGDADVGLEPRDARDSVDAVLREGDLAAKRSLLTGPSRDEAHHRAMRPLESVVTHLEFQAPHLLGGAVNHVVLVATRQDPPHPRDTEPIARALVEVLTEQPDAFGAPLLAEVVLVPTMSAEAFATAVATSPAVQAASEVVVGLAGGAVAATIGVLGGVLQLGVVPVLLEANRQDHDLDVEPRLVHITADVAAWLARNRQYEALQALVDTPDAKALCQALQRATRGEWTLQRPEHLPADAVMKRLAEALDAPRTDKGVLEQPKSAAAFGRWRDVVDRVLVAEVAGGETSALPMLEMALRCRVNADAQGLGHELAEAAEGIRVDSLAANFHSRAKNILPEVNVQRTTTALLRSNPDMAPEDLVDELLAGARTALEEAYRGATANVDDLDAYDTVLHHRYRDHPERLPDRLRPLLTANRLRWRGLAVDTRHGLNPTLVGEAREVLVAEGVTGEWDVAEAQAVTALGFTPPAPLDASQRLVFMCVGERNIPDNDPMVSAMLAHLGDTTDVHLVLVASEGGERPTLARAEGIRTWLTALARTGTLIVDIACVDGADVAAVETARDRITRTVAGVDRRRIAAVEVFIGPGTKAMNVAACLVGLEQSFALSTPLALLLLLPGNAAGVEAGSTAPTTVVVPTFEAFDGWRRLIDDTTLATVLRSALRRLDVGLMTATLQRAPRAWHGVAARVDDLSVLLGASVGGQRRALQAAMERWHIDDDHLMSSRLQQLSALLSPERRLALTRMAVTLSDRFPDSGQGAWKGRGAAAKALWDGRVAAIKHVWNPVPDPPGLKTLLDDLDLPWLDRWPLADVVAAIAQGIDEVEHPRPSYTLVNLTPHSVTIATDDGSLTIPVSGLAARVELLRGELEAVRVDALEVPVGWSAVGTEVVGLPEARPGQLIIVARMVAEAAPDRADLVFPDDLVRDDSGAVVACRRLCRLGNADVARL